MNSKSISIVNKMSRPDLVDLYNIYCCSHVVLMEEIHPDTLLTVDPSDLKTFSQEELGIKEITISGINTSLDQLGFRPATLRELIVWGATLWNRIGRVYTPGIRLHPGSEHGHVPNIVQYQFLIRLDHDLIVENTKWCYDWIFLAAPKQP